MTHWPTVISDFAGVDRGDLAALAGPSGSVSIQFYHSACSMQTFGIGDTALCWFQSYICRPGSSTLYVRRDPNKSSITYPSAAYHNVCLRPGLCLEYGSPGPTNSEKKWKVINCRVDDTQVYGYCRTTTSWMRSNKLQTTPTLLDDSINYRHRPCWSTVDPSLQSRLFATCRAFTAAVIILSIRTHVQHTTSRYFASLRQLRQIRIAV